jgi:hypothetical protein
MAAAIDFVANEDLQQSAGHASIELVRITPSCARDWMRKLNTRNFRPYSAGTAERYADDMVSRHFGDRPETAGDSNIMICTDPKTGKTFLANGQHRLGGCIRAHERDATFPGFWCGVMRGMDPIVVLRADTGKKRKLSDYLHYMGVPNHTIVAPTLRILFTYQNGKEKLGTDLLGTPDELLELLDRRGDIHKAVKFAATAAYGNKSIPMTPSWLAVARMLIGEVPGVEADADDFWASLASDDNINLLANSDHPIRQMRRLLRHHGTLVKADLRWKPHIMFGHLLKCWNNSRDNVNTKLTFRPGTMGSKGGEPWPVPH